MIIAFDAKRAVQNNTGLGNYSRYVIEALETYYPQHHYLLYAPHRRENARLETLLAMDHLLATRGGGIGMSYPRGVLWPRLPGLWRLRGMCSDVRGSGAAVFHGLSNELPFGIEHLPDTRSVVTIHDLIFHRFPEGYRAVDRQIYDRKFSSACRRADRIVAVSECTARDITDLYDIDPRRIDVIYQGCDESFSRRATQTELLDVAVRYRLPHDYILQVGSIETRKNALATVLALRRLPHGLHLVLVGRRTPYADQIEKAVREEGLSARVHILYNVSYADLPAVYQQAVAFVYPSRYEGFGIPVLEALRSGLPVVAATGSCLEEAGGEGQLYVCPDDTDGLAQAIEQTFSRDTRREMTAAGRAWAARFTPRQMATETMAVYMKVMSEDEM